MAKLLHNEFAPDSIQAKDLEYVLHPTTNLAQHMQTGPMVIERAKGVYLYDDKGKQYLEGMAGFGVPRLVMARKSLFKLRQSRCVSSAIRSCLPARRMSRAYYWQKSCARLYPWKMRERFLDYLGLMPTIPR